MYMSSRTCASVFIGYVSRHGNAKSKAIGNSDIAKLPSPEVMTIFTPTCNVKQFRFYTELNMNSAYS